MMIDLRYLTREIAPNQFEEVLQFSQVEATKIESAGIMVPCAGWTGWKDVPHIIKKAVND